MAEKVKLDAQIAGKRPIVDKANETLEEAEQDVEDYLVQMDALEAEIAQARAEQKLLLANSRLKQLRQCLRSTRWTSCWQA